MKNIDKIRRDYMLRSLDDDDLKSNPFDMFTVWFDEAIVSDIKDVNAMTLATVCEKGHPSTRIVLLKGIEDAGFVFYTNYDSKKGSDIGVNPNVSLCFFWPELERQVRINGTCEKISTYESEKYFRSRPYESQIGAWASVQSATIKTRQELQSAFESLQSKYPNVDSVPYPIHWGGYRVIPSYFEFWQGRASRLHDRYCYILTGGHWFASRLSP
jgi:pyridoxamine 5'-phosphate oxidase